MLEKETSGGGGVGRERGWVVVSMCYKYLMR
jgi:hypothetical protein